MKHNWYMHEAYIFEIIGSSPIMPTNISNKSSSLNFKTMNFLIPNMRVAMLFVVAFMLTLIFCSCSDGTKHVLVIPRIYADSLYKDINLEKQVWRVSEDELAMVQEGDTIQFSHTYDNDSSTNTGIVITKEVE